MNTQKFVLNKDGTEDLKVQGSKKNKRFQTMRKFWTQLSLPSSQKKFQKNLIQITVAVTAFACLTTLQLIMKEKIRNQKLEKTSLLIRPNETSPSTAFAPLLFKNVICLAVFFFNAIIWTIATYQKTIFGHTLGYWIGGFSIVCLVPLNGEEIIDKDFIIQNYCVTGILAVFSYHFGTVKAQNILMMIFGLIWQLTNIFLAFKNIESQFILFDVFYILIAVFTAVGMQIMNDDGQPDKQKTEYLCENQNFENIFSLIDVLQQGVAVKKVNQSLSSELDTDNFVCMNKPLAKIFEKIKVLDNSEELTTSLPDFQLYQLFLETREQLAAQENLTRRKSQMEDGIQLTKTSVGQLLKEHKKFRGFFRHDYVIPIDVNVQIDFYETRYTFFELVIETVQINQQEYKLFQLIEIEQLELMAKISQLEIDLDLCEKLMHDQLTQIDTLQGFTKIQQCRLTQINDESVTDIKFLSDILWSGVTILQQMTEVQTCDRKIKNNSLLISFQEKPNLPMNEIVHDFFKPLLIQSLDQKIQVVIREMNTIPDDICIDLRVYQRILFQLVRNSLQNNLNNSRIYIDMHYFEVRDVEWGHRMSLIKDQNKNQSSNNYQGEFQEQGFLVTRIVDKGKGMSFKTIKSAIDKNQLEHEQMSLSFRTRNVCYGLRTVVNQIEAQGCLIKISSEPGKGTEIIFSVQTRKQEMHASMETFKDLAQKLIMLNVSLEEVNKTQEIRMFQAKSPTYTDSFLLNWSGKNINDQIQSKVAELSQNQPLSMCVLSDEFKPTITQSESQIEQDLSQNIFNCEGIGRRGAVINSPHNSFKLNSGLISPVQHQSSVIPIIRSSGGILRRNKSENRRNNKNSGMPQQRQSNILPQIIKNSGQIVKNQKQTVKSSIQNQGGVISSNSISNKNAPSFDQVQEERKEFSCNSSEQYDLASQMEQAQLEEQEMIEKIIEMQLRQGINRNCLQQQNVRFDSSEVVVLPNGKKNLCFQIGTINDIQNGVTQQEVEVQRQLLGENNVSESLGDDIRIESNESSEIQIEGSFVEQSYSNRPIDACRCNATVLLADDNPFNLIPLRVILEQNYQIYCDLVENGKQELDSFIQNNEKTCCQTRYRLILTDLNMPVMDGFDASRNILKYQDECLGRPGGLDIPNFVPIVAVTAYDDQGTYEQCLKIGMSAVLNKPVNFEKMDKIIKKLYFDRLTQGQNLIN